jgi:hypothetical protein
MPDRPLIDRPPSALPRPTLAVLISSVLVLLSCGTGVVSGLIAVAFGVYERAYRPPGGEPPWVDPLYLGLLIVLPAGFIGWCQYGAVRYRSPVRSYIVGILYFVLGMVLCVLIPWRMSDFGHLVVTVAALFVGVSMVRWGWQLSRR